MLNPWMPYPYAPVSAVEHRVGGVKPYKDGEEGLTSASMIVVVEAPWPGDADKEKILAEIEAQGWNWAPTAAELLAGFGAAE